MPRFKEGVVFWGMSPEITSVLDDLDRGSMEYVGRPIIITGAREGLHMEGSKHYTGEAIDIRVVDLPPDDWQTYANSIRNKLNAWRPGQFQVVLESNHIHIEFDPDDD